MRRNIIVAFSAIVLAGGIIVAGKAVVSNRNVFISSNIDVLSDGENITIGHICAYQPETTCDWYYPDGSWDILFDLIPVY